MHDVIAAERADAAARGAATRNGRETVTGRRRGRDRDVTPDERRETVADAARMVAIMAALV